MNKNEYANTNYCNLALLKMKMLRAKRKGGKEGRREQTSKQTSKESILGLAVVPTEWRVTIATTNQSLLQCPDSSTGREEGAGVF